MPTFETPHPILIALELGVADVRLTASERTDTNVEVRPSDPAKKSDVAAAEQTRVEYADGRLLIRAPKGWRRHTPRGGGESIDVQVDLPAGSRLLGSAGVAALHSTGPLGECHYKTGVGDFHIEHAGEAHISTGLGDITVDRVAGDAEISSASGAVRIGFVGGAAVIKNSNGETWIGEIARDLRVVSANGSIAVDHAHATVAAKTANGSIRLGDVGSGTVVALTALGKVEIGIRDGVAAWLDLDTHFGTVRNELDAADRPPPGDRAVEVRARTSFGDITIRRSVAGSTAVGAA
ncbi:MAG: DUF4097 family beta strand repeat-containing protein [Candidatus Dormibacter sp.]